MSSPELSIDPVASSTKEPLTNLSQSEYRRLTTPISEFSFTGKPLSNLDWRGGYIYYRYQGPATLDQSYNGTAPNSSGALAPYTVSQSARDTVTEPDNIVYQGFTYKVRQWWEIIADYRYSRFSTDSRREFRKPVQHCHQPHLFLAYHQHDARLRTGLLRLAGWAE